MECKSVHRRERVQCVGHAGRAPGATTERRTAQRKLAASATIPSPSYPSTHPKGIGIARDRCPATTRLSGQCRTRNATSHAWPTSSLVRPGSAQPRGRGSARSDPNRLPFHITSGTVQPTHAPEHRACANLDGAPATRAGDAQARAGAAQGGRLAGRWLQAARLWRRAGGLRPPQLAWPLGFATCSHSFRAASHPRYAASRLCAAASRHKTSAVSVVASHAARQAR